MKTLFNCLLALAVLLPTNCKPPTTGQIDDLHAASLKASMELTPKLETLVLRSNSIHIQGRALTTEELEFTSQVMALQSAFTEWKEAMEKVASKKPDAARLETEKSLNHSILNLSEQVDKMLAPQN